jgi:hypothetical protein
MRNAVNQLTRGSSVPLKCSWERPLEDMNYVTENIVISQTIFCLPFFGRDASGDLYGTRGGVRITATPPRRSMIAGRRWFRYWVPQIPQRAYVCMMRAKVQLQKFIFP